MERFTLNREKQLRFIADCLTWLSTQVKIRNSVCFYDINHIAEDVYCDLLNSILGLNLTNQNATCVNCAAIDLIDSTNRVVVQVSSTRTKTKLKNSINKIDTVKYCGYRFVFVSISDEPPAWASDQISVPSGICVNLPGDVIGPQGLMHLCNSLDIKQLGQVYHVCCIHFGNQEKSSLLQQEDVRLFFAMFTEIMAKESLICDYCTEYLDENNPGGKHRLSSISFLSKNQLHDLFVNKADGFLYLRNRLLPHHRLLEIVRHLELLHHEIDNCAAPDEQYMDIKRMRELLMQERNLVVDALSLFSDDLGINREDMFEEFTRAMNE